MKIVFLSTFYPYRGGIAQFNALIYREMEKTNEVEAITFSRQYPDLLFPGKTQMVSEKDDADAIPAKRWLDTVNPFTYLLTARKIKKSSPDLILTKYWMTFFAPSLGFVLGKQAKKTIRISILDNVIPHEKRFFDTAFNKYFLKRNDGFVVMSEKVRDDLLSVKPDAKYVLIPHPIYNQFGPKLEKSEARKLLNVPSDKKVLLFFGIIRDYKGLDYLIEAMSLLDETYHLIVAGEVYGSFEKYDQLIAKYNLQNRISVFSQYIDDAEVKNYFSAADVCVLPYKSATQSGITNISYHFEVPIIATNVGGLAETIEHGKTGLITETVSPKGIADQITTYYQAKQVLLFAENIRKHNHENSWQAFTEKLLAFYNSLK